MPKKKDKLLQKLMQSKLPRNFTTGELDTLMSQCNCEKRSGGRGSGIAFYHKTSGRILSFDGPHPGNELYPYHIRMVRKFLSDVGELEDE